MVVMVMSRDLCKLAKCARVPLQVKWVEDREGSPLHALHIHETHHRAGVMADFDEAPLNHIGRPELVPEGPRTLREDNITSSLDSLMLSPCCLLS